MALFRRILRYLFSSVFLGIVTVVGVPVVIVATVLAGLIFLPLPATIPIPKANPVLEPTTIYDRNGVVIATLQQYDQNVPVAENAIAAVLKEAVISDEDRNFYKHGGVDIRGTVRAAVADIRNKRTVQGGSTITQQYVKLAFTGGNRNLIRKIREAVLASQLDRQASKDEILYRYLTTLYFGDGNYGIGAAAKNYFHTDVGHLTASQSAALAGLIPAPSARAPRENMAEAEYYRVLVLGKMLAQGYLTQAQHDAALASHLTLQTANPPPGATIVYPQATSASKYPDFVDYVTRSLLGHYPPAKVYGGGLRVQTTLNPPVQDAAYASVRSTLKGTVDPLEMGLAAVEPQTGFVEALVGGRDFGGKGRYSNDNFALGGCEYPKGVPRSAIEVPATCYDGNTITGGAGGRQPGSAWKPFVLATAFSQGVQPTRTFDAPGTLPIPNCKVSPSNSCTISNDEPGSYGGQQTLAQAMVQSTNTVYAQLAPQVGCANVARTAKALGISSAYYSPRVQTYCQTYALGVVGVSALDMASAYGVFADHGEKADPTPILEVIDGSGKVIVNNIAHAPATTGVLSPNVADNVTNVLQGVIASGTGTAAQLGRPAAGKTGTTSNYTNAWFAGYTPSLSTAVWMGNADSESKTIGDVKGTHPVYGGTLPAMTWQSFMSSALASVPATPFNQPAPIQPPAVALTPSAATTAPPLEPGSATSPRDTPIGGPYINQPPNPKAPYPFAPFSNQPTTTTTTAIPGFGGGSPLPPVSSGGSPPTGVP
ncbi:MAG: transglycosylase domain-containing protein [Actinomycetota bacterium]|nr:transglycosylase domain-containing protein [Actinomycetota bacterium]